MSNISPFKLNKILIGFSRLLLLFIFIFIFFRIRYISRAYRLFDTLDCICMAFQFAFDSIQFNSIQATPHMYILCWTDYGILWHIDDSQRKEIETTNTRSQAHTHTSVSFKDNLRFDSKPIKNDLTTHHGNTLKIFARTSKLMTRALWHFIKDIKVATFTFRKTVSVCVCVRGTFVHNNTLIRSIYAAKFYHKNSTRQGSTDMMW